jgi:hypothetical protein
MFLSEEKLKIWFKKWRNLYSEHDVEELELRMNDIKHNYLFDKKIASKLLENLLFDWAYNNTLIANKLKINVHDNQLNFYIKESLIDKITHFINENN